MVQNLWPIKFSYTRESLIWQRCKPDTVRWCVIAPHTELYIKVLTITVTLSSLSNSWIYKVTSFDSWHPVQIAIMGPRYFLKLSIIFQIYILGLSVMFLRSSSVGSCSIRQPTQATQPKLILYPSNVVSVFGPNYSEPPRGLLCSLDGEHYGSPCKE